MFDRLFDLPLFVTGPAIIVSLCLLANCGLLLVRRRVLPRLRVNASDSEFSGAMVQSVMAFFGLSIALIAVSVFQTYSDVSKVVSQEATSLGALYRDLSGYPEPARAELQDDIRDYTDQVIHEAWPQLRRGQVPTGGVERMNRFQEKLLSFEPATDGQRLVHAETLRAYNAMILARRMRLDAVNAGLPSVMWIVILAGAAISLSACFFFQVEDVRLHGVMVTLLATFIGLVIFMIVALDRPYRGDLGIGPESYQLVRDQIMKPSHP